MYPRIASPELDFGRAEELGGRCRLLADLNLALDDDEAAAEILLKAFDLSLDDYVSKPSRFDDIHIPAQPGELTQVSLTDLPPSASQNPFLSTPLRLKHFSKLSPSILREILRSPSIRCDDSLDSVPESNDLSSFGSPLTTPQWRPNDSPHAANADSDLQSRQPSLPLTPPPTGRIPFSTLPDDPVKLCNVSDLPIPRHIANATHTVFHTTQPSLVSPSVVRNFQRVIDEMKGVDSSQEATRINDEVSFLLLSSPDPSSPTGRIFGPENDTHDISPLNAPPLAKDRTLGTLEDEFMTLLQQRAMEEEADAKELRALASRLERIAKGRRHLATSIEQRRKDLHSEGKFCGKK
ncbi:hypothetical protein B0H19DRAFT_1177325 [Mycena capillaripes]|nr:hypothetical protein B0H19DRAFT_1177325 [Mycena capillaripes]